MQKIDVIKTERLILRPLRMDDLDTAYKWHSDAEYMKYSNPPHTDIKETAEHLEWVTNEWESDHQTYYGFGIVLGDKLIGEISFSHGCGKCGRCVEGEVSIGCGVYSSFQNRDYEKEAVSAVIDYCFSALDADIIKMCCDVESVDELRLIKSLGMKLKVENEDCEYNDGRAFKRNIYYLDNFRED